MLRSCIRWLSPSLSGAAIALLTGATLLGCRGCDGGVGSVRPSLEVGASTLDFGPVKVGRRAQARLQVRAASRAPVTIGRTLIEGDVGYVVERGVSTIEALAESELTLAFAPTSVGVQEARLQLESDDAERPVQVVRLIGEGASPVLGLALECGSARGCTATLSESPRTIDFGANPASATPVEASRLPLLQLGSDGPVSLWLRSLSVEGPGAAAFTLVGAEALPQEGVELAPREGFSVPIRFSPSPGVTSYEATLVVRSDDPAAPEAQVALRGTLLPNQPPRVCANLIRVSHRGQTTEWRSASDWAPLLQPPPSGYDFSSTRLVPPGAQVVLSATSSEVDPTACTTDLESGRAGLGFRWRVVGLPAGAAAPVLAGETTPQLSMQLSSTGVYQLILAVTDPQGLAAEVPVRFVAGVRDDLVVELSWLASPQVDLDLHLVRPSAGQLGAPLSGVFEFFSAGEGKTSGDLNGYAASRLAGGNQYNFDWGRPGVQDDPRLNLDDLGTGARVENISLNQPEADAQCDGGPCTYRVVVHYFRDARSGGDLGACLVDGGAGCGDGDRCECPSADSRCVASNAPRDAAPRGAGVCRAALRPEVRIFVGGAPEPVQTVAIDALGAPCSTVHVADVLWPAAGSWDGGVDRGPLVTVPGGVDGGVMLNATRARFGFREQGSLQCSPNIAVGGVDWFEPAPL